MKELSIEQKAKAYDEALEKIKYVMEHGVQPVLNKEDLQDIFPELKESEDERVREELIDYINRLTVTSNNIDKYNTWIAWLEKQGEQKPVDKVKPKFHKDDWVVNNDTGDVFQVNEIRDGKYCLWPIDGEIVEHLRIIAVDTDYHLWTIQEAKDGDALTDVYGNIGIYEKCDDFNWTSYCSLGHNGGFQPFEVEHENEKTYPATKEQCDTLFTKMKEAGYEWDAEKKELKKFHVIDEGKDEMDYCFTKMMIGEKVSSAWTEEDEHRAKDTMYFLETAKKHYASTVELDACIDWLKSLRDKKQWKPNDEQMAALSSINVTGCVSYAGQGQKLINLYNDLKKLMEEQQ